MRCPKCNSEEIDATTPRTVYACGSSDYDQRPNTFIQSDECKLQLTQDEKTICEYSGLPSLTSYVENEYSTVGLSVGINPNHFKVDFSKVKTLDDIIVILKAMDLTVSWYTKTIPEKFQDIHNKGFLTKEGINN
jgi:hypothetical protein